MTIGEIVIAHLLYGVPGMTHVTPDGEKLYFLVEKKLVCVPAAENSTYKGMSDEELDRVRQDHILHLTDSQTYKA